jgi:hypothetical protein
LFVVGSVSLVVAIDEYPDWNSKTGRLKIPQPKNILNIKNILKIMNNIENRKMLLSIIENILTMKYILAT